jgi:hypothetical protein
MTNGWDGPDPSPVSDGAASTYELATRGTANAGITITAIRVWATQSQNVANRNARIWTTGGSLQRTIDIDDTLPTSGWTEYAITPGYEVADGESFDVSYSTTNYYGAVSGSYPNDSSDANLTYTQGRFSETHGQFPSTTTATFYGIDVVYSLSSENQPPAFGGLTLSKSDLTVTGIATVTDETPATVALRWDWGDGQTTNTGAGVLTAQHTYSASGLYAVLVTATDNGGLTDTIARAVSVTVENNITASEEWTDDIVDAIVSDAQMSGYFDKVNTHEPKRAPGSGLTAAVWLEAIDPISLNSGLASTSARLVFKLRIYQSMLMEPQDLIDPRLTKAVANLMRRYHDDFDFAGTIRNVDLLGAFGVSLSAVTGYLDIDGKMFRVADITIPCLVNDVWPQVS